MKFLKYASAALAALSLSACSDDFFDKFEKPELPPMVLPTAPYQANTTILELKQQYWNDAKNYIDTIRTKENGEHIIVKGRVTGVDVSGNIYKYLYIQDETAALGFSIDASSLNTSYKVGQEVVVDMTAMNIGKWNTELLVGKPEWYAAGNVWEAGRMADTTFTAHAAVSGLPNPLLPTPQEVKVSDFCGTKGATADSLITFGHKLVTFKNVRLKYTGKSFATTAAPTQSNTTGVSAYNEYIVDSLGNEILMPVSAFANFVNESAGTGYGDVTGILVYKYVDRKSQWALYLVDYNGLKGFTPVTSDTPDTPDTPGVGEGGDGSQATPYTVTQTIALGNPGTEAWVEGYIVGWYNYDNNSALETSPEGAVPTNIALAASPTETDKAKTVAVQLPVGDIRTALNLTDNPEAIGVKVAIKGKLMKYFGLAGLKECSAFEFKK